MSKIRAIKLAVLSVGLLVTGYYMVHQAFTSLAQNKDGQSSNRDLGQYPPQVEEFKARLLEKASGKGNVALFVRFAKEEDLPRKIDIQLEGKDVTFRDDGDDGDEKAGDGIYSAIAPVNLDELEKDQKRIASIKSALIFRGRELIAEKKIDRESLPVRRDAMIDLMPVGDPDNISIERSLMITAPGVVQDPSRTRSTCNSASTGRWSFAYLMTQMANTPLTGISPEDFTLRWLNEWRTAQTVNSFNVPARAAGINTLIANWPKVGGKLDLSRAPLRLLAIVNRADLRGTFSYGGGGSGNGGELRFVFAVLGPAPTCSVRQFTVIFEFGVRKDSCKEMKDWAQQWKNLDTMVPGSAQYNKALETITEQIVKANAAPGKPNKSALNQLRTNEFTLGGGPWELREFQISPGSHLLDEVTVKQTPDNSFNITPDLGSYVNAFTGAILLDRHTVPLTFAGKPFLGGASPVPGNNLGFRWRSPSIVNLEARFHFSLQTCNSCHTGETRTLFTHVQPAGFGAPVQLSRFLRGNTPSVSDNEFFLVTDPFNSNVRKFNDLRRRAADLDALINTPCFRQLAIKPILMAH